MFAKVLDFVGRIWYDTISRNDEERLKYNEIG